VQLNDEYEIVLRPEARWLDVDFAALWRYRDLLTLLVWRDFVAKYKQTILGPAWFILQPLLMTIVLTVVFGNLIRLSTDGLPPLLFYLCGQLGWNYFAQTFSANASSLISNAHLLSKVYFPRLIVPISNVLSNLFIFGVQAATFAVFFVVFKYGLKSGTFGVNWHIVFLPLLVLLTACFSLAAGLLMSAVTAKYRDLTHVTAVLIQMWMYATPVIYPLSRFPERWRWVAALNPLTAMVESYRLMMLGVGTVEPWHLVWSVTATCGALIAGVALFDRMEKTFVDNL
jgi:lipopolysaccharide transport system permease protein